ncbi:MAG: DUF2007 domain-containing protein [Pirellulales bacterium]|nr:DUF2007 domain-containing protein [Planctomycetales bacterium]
MDADELVEVCTVRDAIKAEIIKNALADEGIPCDIENESQAAMTGIFDIRIMVPAWHADHARKLIESHDHE